MNQLDRILEVTGRPSPQDVDSIQSPFAGACTRWRVQRAAGCKRWGGDRQMAAGDGYSHSISWRSPTSPASRRPATATMLESMRAPATPRLEATFPSASPEALDLLRRLLHFNPDMRISPEEALRHPYCAQFHNPHDEPVAPAPITIPIDDNTKYSISEYRERLYLEIVRRKKELRRAQKERDAQRAASRSSKSRGAAAAAPAPGGAYGYAAAQVRH